MLLVLHIFQVWYQMWLVILSTCSLAFVCVFSSHSLKQTKSFPLRVFNFGCLIRYPKECVFFFFFFDTMHLCSHSQGAKNLAALHGKASWKPRLAARWGHYHGLGTRSHKTRVRCDKNPIQPPVQGLIAKSMVRR